MSSPPMPSPLVAASPLALSTIGAFFERDGWGYFIKDYLHENSHQRGRVVEVRGPGVGDKPLALFTLAPAVLMEPASLILTPQGRPLRESLFYPELSLALTRTTPGALPLQQLHGSFVPLTTTWYSEYWHWIHEFLPRVVLAERGGFTGGYLISPTAPSFVASSLALLGIAPERVVRIRPGGYLVELLCIPEIVRASYELPEYPWILADVRREILSRVTRRDDTPRRLYISRQGASRRRLHREEEIIALLGNHGFVSVQLEKLPFLGQVELFAGAEVVVGVHGAGLANSLFLPRGAQVVELFSPHFAHPNSPVSNTILELRHTALCGELADHPPPASPHEANFQDVVIDPAALEALLLGPRGICPAS